MMISANERDFTKEVLECNRPVLVNFWAPWCGVCRLITPNLLKFQAQTNGLVKLVSINADENLKLANTYKLKNLPTILVFDRGKVIDRIEGFQGREQLDRNLDRLLLRVSTVSTAIR